MMNVFRMKEMKAWLPLLAVIVVLAFGACSDNATVSGSAAGAGAGGGGGGKGPFQNGATVILTKLGDDNTLSDTVQAGFDPARTDGTLGSFQIGKLAGQVVLAKVTGGTYRDEATGQIVTMPASVTLRSITTLANSGDDTISISPLTEMLARSAVQILADTAGNSITTAAAALTEARKRVIAAVFPSNQSSLGLVDSNGDTVEFDAILPRLTGGFGSPLGAPASGSASETIANVLGIFAAQLAQAASDKNLNAASYVEAVAKDLFSDTGSANGQTIANLDGTVTIGSSGTTSISVVNTTGNIVVLIADSVSAANNVLSNAMSTIIASDTVLKASSSLQNLANIVKLAQQGVVISGSVTVSVNFVNTSDSAGTSTALSLSSNSSLSSGMGTDFSVFRGESYAVIITVTGDAGQLDNIQTAGTTVAGGTAVLSNGISVVVTSDSADTTFGALNSLQASAGAQSGLGTSLDMSYGGNLGNKFNILNLTPTASAIGTTQVILAYVLTDTQANDVVDAQKLIWTVYVKNDSGFAANPITKTIQVVDSSLVPVVTVALYNHLGHIIKRAPYNDNPYDVQNASILPSAAGAPVGSSATSQTPSGGETLLMVLTVTSPVVNVSTPLSNFTELITSNLTNSTITNDTGGGSNLRGTQGFTGTVPLSIIVTVSSAGTVDLNEAGISGDTTSYVVNGGDLGTYFGRNAKWKVNGGGTSVIAGLVLPMSAFANRSTVDTISLCIKVNDIKGRQKTTITSILVNPSKEVPSVLSGTYPLQLTRVPGTVGSQYIAVAGASASKGSAPDGSGANASADKLTNSLLTGSGQVGPDSFGVSHIAYPNQLFQIRVGVSDSGVGTGGGLNPDTVVQAAYFINLAQTSSDTLPTLGLNGNATADSINGISASDSTLGTNYSLNFGLAGAVSNVNPQTLGADSLSGVSNVPDTAYLFGYVIGDTTSDTQSTANTSVNDSFVFLMRFQDENQNRSKFYWTTLKIVSLPTLTGTADTVEAISTSAIHVLFDLDDADSTSGGSVLRDTSLILLNADSLVVLSGLHGTNANDNDTNGDLLRAVELGNLSVDTNLINIRNVAILSDTAIKVGFTVNPNVIPNSAERLRFTYTQGSVSKSWDVPQKILYDVNNGNR